MFLGVIVAMHLASITSQSGLLIWLVGLVAACLAVNAAAAMRAVRNVQLNAPSRILIEEGSPALEPWELRNSGKNPARLITIESKDRVWLALSEVPAHGSASATPRDVFKKRGAHSLQDAWLVSLYPFGLVKAMRAIDSDAEVLVFPKLQQVSPPAVRGLDPMVGGRHTGPGRIASGETFAGIRPAQPGDSFKQIHWKSSAKGGGLMVKTFEEELAGRAAILVHCDLNSPIAEACLRAAGSLALAGIDAGHQIEFHNLNEQRRIRIPPFGDRSRLLEELARYDTSAKNNDGVLDTIPIRSAIHVVATSWSSQLQNRLQPLLTSDHLLILHLPAGARAHTDRTVQHYATQ